MTQGLPPKPSCLSIVGGILLAALVLATFVMLPSLVKWAGAIFTFLPSRVGLIQIVEPAEVMPVDFTDSPTSVVFARPGKYAVFTVNYDLLAINDAVLAAKAKPWFKLIASDGTEVEIALIERGLAFYDTPFASGRPVARFQIDAPGGYTMTHPRRPDYVYIVPDYTAGQERAITFYMLAQFVVFGAGAWYLRRKTRRRPTIIVPPPPTSLTRARFEAERTDQTPGAMRTSRPASWAEQSSPPSLVTDEAPALDARDVLLMVNEGTLTAQQAEGEIEAQMLSQPVGTPGNSWGGRLALTSVEAAAYSQGAGIDDLLTLRRDGWPLTCAKCGHSLDPQQFQWWFVRDEQGAPALRHIDCPPART